MHFIILGTQKFMIYRHVTEQFEDSLIQFRKYDTVALTHTCR